MLHTGVRLVAIAIAQLSCAGAYAETPADPTAPSEPRLLENGGGARARLFEMGVDLQLGFVGEFTYSADGGTKSLGGFTGKGSP